MDIITYACHTLTLERNHCIGLSPELSSNCHSITDTYLLFLTCFMRSSLLHVIHAHGQIFVSLQWRHNGRDGVSNHQPYHCLLQPFIRAQIKENIKAPRHWPLCGEFTAQMASNAENVSIWLRRHVILMINDGDKVWWFMAFCYIQ